MPKSTSGSKSKKNTKTQEESQTVVSEPVVLSQPEVVVSETVVLSENVVTSESEVLEESSTEVLFNKLLNQFLDVQSVMKTLHSNLKVLQKEVLRERKESKKKESKIKKKGNKNKAASGFAKPSSISTVLSDFLGLEHNQQIARTDVTAKVIGYVKAQNLQNPENKKQIIPDAKLGTVLQSGEDVVTFFNLQTYLKKHFIPSVTVVTETSVPTVV
jgi:chromatin remodeling complex protein RSC6